MGNRSALCIHFYTVYTLNCFRWTCNLGAYLILDLCQKYLKWTRTDHFPKFAKKFNFHLFSLCCFFFFFHGRLLWFLIGERGIKENQIMIALDPQNKKVKGTFMKHFASLNVYDCQSLVIDCILISPIYFYF